MPFPQSAEPQPALHRPVAGAEIRRRLRERPRDCGETDRRLPALLREHPRQQLGLAVGVRPRVVPRVRILAVHRLAAGFFQSGDQLARPHDRHRGVEHAVKRPHRHRFRDRDPRRIAAAADRCRRCPAPRCAREQIPRPVAAHREAGHVEPVSVHGEFLEHRVERAEGELHRVGRLLLVRVRPGPAFHRAPRLVRRALRREDVAGKLVAILRLRENGRTVLDLRGVVRPALACAVEEKDERIFFPRLHGLRREQPVAERGPVGGGESARLIIVRADGCGAGEGEEEREEVAEFHGWEKRGDCRRRRGVASGKRVPRRA